MLSHLLSHLSGADDNTSTGPTYPRSLSRLAGRNELDICLDEILTVNRLGLPAELRRSLACTNIIENTNGTVRRVGRNVKHWLDAAMALRWTGAAMLEAAKGFRRLKAHRQLPILKAALAAHGARHTIKPVLERQSAAA